MSDDVGPKVPVTARVEWTPTQITAARRVVGAALALDRRSHSWSEWYRQTYHFVGAVDEPTWDEFDAALTAFIAVTDIAALAETHWPASLEPSAPSK